MVLRLVPGQVWLHDLLSSTVSWDLLDFVRGLRILGSCLCDGILGNAWSNSQPNFGCLVSNNNWIVLVCCGTIGNGNACTLLLCNFLHISSCERMSSSIVSLPNGPELAVSHFIEALSGWNSFSCIDIHGSNLLLLPLRTLFFHDLGRERDIFGNEIMSTSPSSCLGFTEILCVAVDC